MKSLTINDINRNNVNTVSQFKILQYLKKALKLELFKIYLYNENTIKVVDKNYVVGFFHYNSKTKKIDFTENKDDLINKENVWEK